MILNIEWEKLKSCRIFIATPTYGGMIHSEHRLCEFKLREKLWHHGIPYVFQDVSDSLVTRSRNNLADMFMNHAKFDRGEDRLLFLDGDITFDPQDILHLVALDKDVIAAPYAMKGINWERVHEAAMRGWPADRLHEVTGNPVCNWNRGDAVDFSKPQQVFETGTGMLMIKRSVFETMRQRLPGIEFIRTGQELRAFKRNTATAYFLDGIDPVTRQFLSEDWWFCRQWNRLGGEVNLCLWMKTAHIGPYHYEWNGPAVAELLSKTKGWINGPARDESGDEAGKPAVESGSGTLGR